jgi:hypothetical protein
MSKTSIKVEIPESKPDLLNKMGEDVLKKHTELGEKSPLNGLDMETFAANLKDGISKRAQAKSLHEQAELLNQQAGLSIGIDKSQNTKTVGTVYSTLTSARNILLGINVGQERKLTEWGFDVVISNVTYNKPENLKK